MRVVVYVAGFGWMWLWLVVAGFGWLAGWLAWLAVCLAFDANGFIFENLVTVIRMAAMIKRTTLDDTSELLYPTVNQKGCRFRAVQLCFRKRRK